ncbi:hypothetical protein DQG23_13290 [Paenibacillus contaminans]|uniref:Rhamnogalacturonase A/B/Epimerase-like pectate lyase domain-containing protein n=2 Tax=Paenibacillus contaminans TaxID=450362 RepID=A0A329MME1_9BACL|nr:hypothetical protein DQG23_13290 [Paenibacillus contaminans]
MRFKRIYSSEVNVKWFGAKGDGIADDRAAVQAAIESVKSTFEQNNVVEGGGTVYLPKGRYRVTDTIYLDKFVKLRGDLSRGGFFFNTTAEKASGTVIYADFANPDKICIDACGFDASTKKRIAYNKIVNGGMIDGKQVSSLHGVCMEDLVVYTERTVFCGIRYCGTVNSKMRNVHSRGFEVGILFNAGWGTEFENLFINAKYHGFAAVHSVIGCSVINPYIDTTAGYNVEEIPQDRIPHYVYNEREGEDPDYIPQGHHRKRVCVYNYWCGSITYTAPIAEGAHIGFVCYNSTVTVNGSHIEQIRDYPWFIVESAVKSINNALWHPGKGIIYAGGGAVTDFEYFYNWPGSFRTYYAYASAKSTSNVITDNMADTTEYSPYVRFNHVGKDAIVHEVYVDPVNGTDVYLGINANNAVKTLNAMAERLDKNRKNIVYIVSGTEAVAAQGIPAIDNADVEIRSLGAGKAKIKSKLMSNNNAILLNDASVIVNGVDLEVESGGADLSYAAMFLVSGNCKLKLSAASVTLSGATSLLKPALGQTANVTATYAGCEFRNPGGGGSIGGSVSGGNGKVVISDASFGNALEAALAANKYAEPEFHVIASTL